MWVLYLLLLLCIMMSYLLLLLYLLLATEIKFMPEVIKVWAILATVALEGNFSFSYAFSYMFSLKKRHFVGSLSTLARLERDIRL